MPPNTHATNTMTPTEKEQLKSYESLLAYCEQALGRGTRSGSEWLFPCPFGAHERPHLAIAAKDGGGVYRCRACDTGGDIFTLAAHLNSLDAKKDFPAVAQAVADALHISLTDSPAHTPRKAPSRRRREYTPPAVCTPTPAPRFISPENEAFIWQRMQQTTAAALEEQARLLRLPAKGLEYIARHPEQGGLALAPDGRLLVIYTATDAAGKLRITACKLRCWKDRTNYPAYLHAGEWTPGRKETDARFLWIAKNGIIQPTKAGEQPRRIYAPTAPYGMQAALAARRVIITEGESDAWAARISLAYFARLAGYSPQDYAAVVAIPGVSSFKAEWMPFFTGKAVALCLDADAAGQKALPHALDMLSDNRTRAHIFTPPNGAKDLRAAFTAYAPAALAEQILQAFTRKPDNKIL